MRLIVNADDLGYTPGVTRGIIRAHREGIVTSTTLMANAPDAEDAGRRARETPSLDCGVHLVFTYGRPLSPFADVRSLVGDDGRFPRPREAMRGHPRADEVLAEARAQYRRARDLVGRDPTHLDTHHWVHDHPTIEEAVIELARETGAAVRSQSHEQRERMRARGIRTPDRFVRDFQHAGNIDVAALVSLLDGLAKDEGTAELMCHPGVPDEMLLGGSSYAAERAVELATLTDPSIRAAIERGGIALIAYRDL